MALLQNQPNNQSLSDSFNHILKQNYELSLRTYTPQPAKIHPINNSDQITIKPADKQPSRRRNKS